jgi:hypothetical protein
MRATDAPITFAHDRRGDRWRGSGAMRPSRRRWADQLIVGLMVIEKFSVQAPSAAEL